jgi:hypothetical protein
MGYYKTNQESLKILREYFTKIKMNILDTMNMLVSIIQYVKIMK